LSSALKLPDTSNTIAQPPSATSANCGAPVRGSIRAIGLKNIPSALITCNTRAPPAMAMLQ